MVRNLVSHGKNAEGKDACSVVHDGGTSLRYGPGYQNACLYSGSNNYSGGDTVWYNYAIATAGTIINENTTAENLAYNSTTATESICPKGWTLPNNTQISAIGNNTNTYVSSFSAVYGGTIWAGSPGGASNTAAWWGTMSDTGYTYKRYNLYYNNAGNLSKPGTDRTVGLYIRCVPKS